MGGGGQHLLQSLQAPPPPAYNPPPPAKTDAPATEINSYGGRTKTIVPASALARADITDGPASHQQDIRANVQTHSPSPPSTVRGESPQTSPPAAHARTSTSSTTTSSDPFSHYGGKSKVITPAPAVVPKMDHPQPEAPRSVPVNQVRVARENSFGRRPQVVVPLPTLVIPPVGGARGKSATLPPTSPKPPSPHRVKPPSPEVRRKASKPSFRSQGITVQFSGRGATDDSRREALRKLGLLKDTSLL